MVGNFLHKTTMRYLDSSSHTPRWMGISPQRFALLCTFLKGTSGSPLSCKVQKGAQECMNWRTTMAPPEASTVGSVVGAGVGKHDVFYWERILASFIQLRSLPTSITLMPLSSMVMTRHIHDLQLGQAFLTAGMKGDDKEVWQE